MVLGIALAHVVDQKRQVEDVPRGHLAVDLAEGAGIVEQIRGLVDRAEAVLVDGVLVVLVELQQAAGVTEGGNELFQDAHLVQAPQQLSQPCRHSQQRPEMGQGLRGDLRRQPRGLLADDLPGVGVDGLVVKVRQVDQPQDGREVAAQLLARPPGCREVRRSHAESAFHAVAEQRRAHGLQRRRGPGLGQKAGGDVAELVGVAEIVAHEKLDRQHPRPGLVAFQLGDAELLAAAEDVARLARVEVHLVAEPEQELVGPADGRGVGCLQGAAGGEVVQLGGAVGDLADPADQVDLAESAPGGA